MSIVKTFTAEDAEKFLKSNTLKSFSVSLPLSTTHNTDKPYPKAGTAKAQSSRSF
jgi:hypothetical protein